MARLTAFSILLLITLSGTLNAFTRVHAGQLVTYWGQNGNEGPLAQACEEGVYDVFVLAFLYIFGEDREPVLNLAGHCDPPSGGCKGLSSDISTCHDRGKKLLLSIGGAVGPYGLASEDDAHAVATYIWNNYLGGQSDNRPLGSAVLDGVDFDIEGGSGAQYYGALAAKLREFSSTVLLSAAPQCPFPDFYLGPDGSDRALDSGLFDYVWVQFYNNPPCQYQAGSTSGLLAAWETWTSALPKAQIFLGLPAAPNAAGSGFLPSSTFLSDVLPEIQQSANYGGVMLWSYYYDLSSGYGAAIKEAVKPIEFASSDFANLQQA